MTRVEAVRTVLNDPLIGEWYRVEHHVTGEDFTAQNVREWGEGGLGELPGISFRTVWMLG